MDRPVGVLRLKWSRDNDIIRKVQKHGYKKDDGMKKISIHRKATAFMLAAVLGFTGSQGVLAKNMSKAKDEKAKAEQNLNNANEQIEAIERKQSQLQGEIDEKDAELVNLLVNMGILEDELDAKSKQLDEVTVELEEARESEKSQYASMKKRIQFMYERGDGAMLEAILGSKDMSEFLNRVEYVSDIYDYDRKLLTQYQNTVTQVAELKTTVETEKAEMEAMQEEYALQQDSLENVLAEKRSQMGSYDNQLASAQAAAAAYKQTIAEQNAIIKEEERKAKEAEERAKAQAAARAAAASQGNGTAGNSDNGNSGNGGSGNGEEGNLADNNQGDTGGSGGSTGGSTDGSIGGGENPSYSTGVSGSDVVNYACQFVGNPYVWGGTSLTNGADCSGFVMSVFAKFGISLPHSSAALQGCGKAVSYANAQPGDLICYSGHVGIYMGGGRIVHAQSTAVGITTSSATYRTIVCVRRVL